MASGGASGRQTQIIVEGLSRGNDGNYVYLLAVMVKIVECKFINYVN